MRTKTRNTTRAIPAGQNSGRCTRSYQRPFSAPWSRRLLTLTVVAVADTNSRLEATYEKLGRCRLAGRLLARTGRRTYEGGYRE
jgi:hypothetical protein